MMPIVVGKLAAQTPSRFRVRSSIPEATTRGGTQAKQAVSPGRMTCSRPLSSVPPLTANQLLMA